MKRRLMLLGLGVLTSSMSSLAAPEADAQESKSIEALVGAASKGDLVSFSEFFPAGYKGNEEKYRDYDFSSAIRNAISHARKTNAKGVLFPAGVFKIKMGPIEIPAGMSLIGRGIDLTAFDFSDDAKTSGFVATKGEGLVFSGFTIKGGGGGVQPENVKNPSLDSFRLCGSGIVLLGVEKGIIFNCKVENFGGTNGRGEANGVAGIWLTAGCKDCIVSSNYVNNCRNGINEDNYFHAEPLRNRIVSNTVNYCRFGVALDSAGLTDTVVERNIIVGCLQSGIDLNKAKSVKILFNSVSECGSENGNSGIVVYGGKNISAENVYVAENVSSFNFGSGIKAAGNVGGVVILNNVCKNNKKNGVFVQNINDDFFVQGNVSEKNGGSGFFFQGNQKKGGVATGNVATENSVGFTIISLVGASFSSNRATGNAGGRTFSLDNSSLNCAFVGNHGLMEFDHSVDPKVISRELKLRHRFDNNDF